MARTYEAMGKIDEAVKYYRQTQSAQRPGNLLQAKRLAKNGEVGMGNGE